MANIAQQLIAPVKISKITPLIASNRLCMTNVPIGQNGFVDGTTNLAPVNWISRTNINSTNTTVTVYVPPTGPRQFYRLRFPFSWTWP